MVIIEEEGSLRVDKCKKSGESHRRCYAVKVCIEKNARKKPSKGKLKETEVCTQRERFPLPSCPPPPPPPIIPPLPPLRNPTRICCSCEPKVVFKKIARKKRRAKTKEKECQAHFDSPRTPKKNTETQCCLGPPNCTRESQTCPKESKDCGHQTTILFVKNDAKCCQTELDAACDAVGNAHDRKTCTMPCCKSCATKRDDFCQVQPNNDDVEKVNNCRANTNKSLGNRPVCEQKYEFPFAGRTPSGNLKVRPSMISYENKEFGILVANRNLIRTSVKRIASCDILHEESPCSPRVPPSPRVCAAENFCGRETSSPCSSLRESCKTAHPRLPPPRLQKTFICHPHDYHNECDHNHLELVEPSYYSGSQADNDDTTQYVVKTHREFGYADGWNYVNPRYQADRQLHSNCRDHQYNLARTHKPDVCSGQRERDLAHSTRNTVKPLHATRDMLFNNACQQAHQQFHEERYFDAEMNVRGDRNDPRDNYNHNYNPDGSHNSESARRRDKGGPKARPAPYIPAFPQDEMCHHRHQNIMSDAEGFYTPTQVNSEDDRACTNATGLSYGLPTRPPQFPGFHADKYDDQPESNMVGRLHYVVKGNVDPDSKVMIGDAAFPVQSVILEIRSKTNEDSSPHGDLHVSSVKLPDFNSLPVRFCDSEPKSHKTVCSEDGVCMRASTRESRESRESRRTADSGVRSIEVQMPPTAVASHDSHLSSSSKPLSQENDVCPDENKSCPRLPPGYGQRQFPENNLEVSRSRQTDDPHLGRPLATSPSRTDLNKDRLESPSVDEIPPPDPGPRRSSQEIRAHEEKIDESDGILPNLDVIQEAVLVFGGINPTEPCNEQNSGKDVCMYVKETDEWSIIGALPHPRTHFGLARVGDDVYIIGGMDPEKKNRLGKNMSVHTNLKVNLRTGKYELAPGLERARSHCGCVAIDTKIYVIGGSIESRATETCLVYDTENRTWNFIAPMDSSRSNMGLTLYENGILVAGGTSKDARKPVLDTVAHYDPTVDRWTSWANLPAPRAFCSLAMVQNQIYLIAGAGLRDVQKRKNSSLADVLHFDQERNVWVEAGVLRHSRHGHASAVLGDSIVIIAGISSHVVGPINTVEIWSPSSATSERVKNFRQKQSGMSAITL